MLMVFYNLFDKLTLTKNFIMKSDHSCRGTDRPSRGQKASISTNEIAGNLATDQSQARKPNSRTHLSVAHESRQPHTIFVNI